MAATNDKRKGKGILRILLPFLALLIALLFVFILWHYYHPNRPIDVHQTHVSQLRQSHSVPYHPPAVQA